MYWSYNPNKIKSAYKYFFHIKMISECRSQAGQQHGGRGSGWRWVAFPCPGCPWGVVVTDVTSGAWPPSLISSLSLSFPLFLLWCSSSVLCLAAHPLCLCPHSSAARCKDSNPSLHLFWSRNSYWLEAWGLIGAVHSEANTRLTHHYCRKSIILSLAA